MRLPASCQQAHAGQPGCLKHAGTATPGPLTPTPTPILPRRRRLQPPDDSYSLHRKLSGAFLACIKLKARVPCRQLFLEAYDAHEHLLAAEEQQRRQFQQQSAAEERMAA